MALDPFEGFEEEVPLAKLALDLNQITGWALWVGDVLYYGYEEFKNNRFSGGGMPFLRFRRWLYELHAIHPIGEVWFEEVRAHDGTDAAHIYGGFLAELTAFCEDMGIPYKGIPVGQIKKSWTGKGNSSKDKMVEEAKKRGFVDCERHDTADALAIAHMMGVGNGQSPTIRRFMQAG